MIQEESGHFFHFDDDVKIYYETHGKGKVTLLCIHGYGSSHESWYDILPFLSDYFTLILIDLKGFGLSSKPGDNKYGVSDQAEIILSFIEKLGLTNIAVAGQSFGAAIVLAAYLKAKTLRKTDCFNKLILIDAALFIDDLPVLKIRLREPILKKIILKIIPAKIITKIALRRMFYEKEKVTKERIERYSKYVEREGMDISLIKTALFMYPDIQNLIVPNLHEINIPVLIIWGENDPLFPATHAYKLNGMIKNSSLRIISQCGHAPQEEKPGETAEIIVNFLMKS